MSRVRCSKVAAALCGIAAIGGVLSAHAQYPGRVDTGAAATGNHLRATAVVEFTGDLAHMKASRLIPIAIWDGMQFQPGALYLAQPAPLAVLPGTQYELEVNGRPKGFFNIGTSESLAGLWIGVGHYQAPKILTAKLQPARVMPYVVRDVDPDKPHFAHRPADDQQQAQKTAAPSIDPDRPTLHERPHSDDSSTVASRSEDVDPDRPTFSRQTEEKATAPAAQSATAIDPDRPRLEYAAPEEQEKLDRPDALAGMPSEMNQMVAVSDPKTTDSESWAFSWSNPNDAAKMRSDLKTVAEQALAPPPAAAKTRTVSERRHAHAKKPVAPQAPILADQEFKVFSLSFGGGAAMVFSARTTSVPVRYITIIAQPDFYGNAQVLLKHVTTDADLDVSPRMRLIDAVDPRGDGRADLLFELQGRTYRQFALYGVSGGQAIRDFVTQPSAN